MDALDIEILRHTLYVAADPAHAARGFLGPWEIARRLGVHGTTVKARLAALRANGVLRGLVMAPHLSILQQRLFTYSLPFADPRAKEEALRALEGDPRIYTTRDVVGDEVWLGLLAEEALEARQLALRIASAAGAGAPSFVYETHHPPIQHALLPVDRRILRALAPDAHRDLESVAREAQTSVRTVRRRLKRLFDARAFSVYPVLDLGRMPGTLPLMLELRLSPGASLAEIWNSFPEWALREAAGDDLALLYLGVPQLSLVQELVRRARDVPGVAHATPRFLLAARVHPHAVQAALDLASAAPLRSPA